MAVEHERWVKEMVGGLTAADRERLRALLGKLKTTMQGRDPNPADGSAAKGERK